MAYCRYGGNTARTINLDSMQWPSILEIEQGSDILKEEFEEAICHLKDCGSTIYRYFLDWEIPEKQAGFVSGKGPLEQITNVSTDHREIKRIRRGYISMLSCLQ